MLTRYGAVLANGDRIQTGIEGDVAYRGGDVGTVTQLNRSDDGRVTFVAQFDEGGSRELTNYGILPEQTWEVLPNYLPVMASRLQAEGAAFRGPYAPSSVAADATASGSSALDTLMGAKIIAPDGGGDDAVRSSVQTYYGETLQTSDDLKTSACCTPYDLPKRIRGILSNVPDEVKAKYYGCGSPTPQGIDGLRVLDLGSGSGRDCYVAAALVGESGRVTGVDMTDAQLDVARAHEIWHAEQFGYDLPNTRFVKGELEKLGELDLEPGSFDLIISNCVINLCTDKPEVFRQAYRLLKPGGELYFSDVYADRRIPAGLVDDPVLYGECLSGALYWGDYQSIVKAAGFIDPRVVDHRRLGIIDPVLKAKLEPILFASITARLMKLENLDAACEDYGQAVIYKGGLEGMERVFVLDAEHEIEAGRVFPVCGNTLSMLMETRFAPYFEVVGDGKTHFGVFPGCAAPDVFAETKSAPTPAPVGGCC